MSVSAGSAVRSSLLLFRAPSLMLVAFRKTKYASCSLQPYPKKCEQFSSPTAFRELDRYREPRLEPPRNCCYSFTLITPGAREREPARNELLVANANQTIESFLPALSNRIPVHPLFLETFLLFPSLPIIWNFFAAYPRSNSKVEARVKRLSFQGYAFTDFFTQGRTRRFSRRYTGE